MTINFERTRDYLKQFDFRQLFIEELGWSRPARKTPLELAVKDANYSSRQIAQLAGVVVFEVEAADGLIPNAKSRAAVQKEIAKLHHENLLIFIDKQRTQSLWYWVKRQDGKLLPREHLFFKGQPGDLFLGKLSQMVFELADFDAEGNVSVVNVARRLQTALDIEKVTKKFFRDFQEQHVEFLALIRGIRDERQRRWYASVLLNRLMFIYFLQKKPPGFLDGGNQNYLRDKLADSKKRGKDQFYSEFLQALFFEGFAKPEEKRSAAAKKLLGKIKYLNGGLFLPHQIEQQNPKISIPDRAFENLFDLFERYSWHLDDTPGGKDDEISPDVLGYIFEKYINQKAFGAYYTRTEITEYLCARTIHRLILDAVNTPASVNANPPAGVKVRAYESLGDLLLDLDGNLCKRLLHEVLPTMSLLDPACGSGAFLVAAMKTLINIYSAIIGRIKFLGDNNLTRWLADIEKQHPSVGYFIKKRIITDNLFGVDVMDEATEIARLRLFLALVASAQTVDDLEPLPNIDFNILPGNSLIGLMRVNDKEFEQRNAQGNLFRKSYKQTLQEKNRLIDNFRHATEYAEDLTALRNTIDEKKQEAYDTLNDILLDEFRNLGIKYEQATWDDKNKSEGKSDKRPLKPVDIECLRPFHWGFEFDDILNARGGFDAIITNPPWEIFKPIAKEFCYEFDPEVERRGTAIKDFEERLSNLLETPAIRKEYLEYASQFPHQSAYFRSAPVYRNQISIINGKKAGTDINLYKLFVERCFHLLRPGGDCGIVVPSGIYSDLGTRQLRELLFDETKITGMFVFENRNEIFEGVHRSFKFVVLSFQKGGQTETFSAAFMRHNVDELDRFPEQGAIELSVELIRRLSPDSLSVMEFKSALDVVIAEKMLRFPLLGEELPDRWNVKFGAEFHMTNDSGLFHESPGKGRLPLYEGKMIWLFEHGREDPRYWISESDASDVLMSPRIRAARKVAKDAKSVAEVSEKDILLGYEQYRLGFRAVTGATNERALVASIIPHHVFAGNSLIVSMPFKDVVTGGKYVQQRAYTSAEMLCCLAMMGSFVCDWSIRQKILTNMNIFYVYQLPVPRLTINDPGFTSIVEKTARLVCTTPEFDDLAKEVGIKSHKQGVTDQTKRAQLRAELDGLVAHLYGLTESEFAHVLSQFPLVADPVKVAAQNAFRDVERGLLQ